MTILCQQYLLWCIWTPKDWLLWWRKGRWIRIWLAIRRRTNFRYSNQNWWKGLCLWRTECLWTWWRGHHDRRRCSSRTRWTGATVLAPPCMQLQHDMVVVPQSFRAGNQRVGGLSTAWTRDRHWISPCVKVCLLEKMGLRQLLKDKPSWLLGCYRGHSWNGLSERSWHLDHQLARRNLEMIAVIWWIFLKNQNQVGGGAQESVSVG